jgi:hypothetical protein
MINGLPLKKDHPLAVPTVNDCRHGSFRRSACRGLWCHPAIGAG